MLKVQSWFFSSSLTYKHSVSISFSWEVFSLLFIFPSQYFFSIAHYFYLVFELGSHFSWILFTHYSFSFCDYYRTFTFFCMSFHSFHIHFYISITSTLYISFDFFSFHYLDVSVHDVFFFVFSLWYCLFPSGSSYWYFIYQYLNIMARYPQFAYSFLLFPLRLPGYAEQDSNLCWFLLSLYFKYKDRKSVV